MSLLETYGFVYTSTYIRGAEQVDAALILRLLQPQENQSQNDCRHRDFLGGALTAAPRHHILHEERADAVHADIVHKFWQLFVQRHQMRRVPSEHFESELAQRVILEESTVERKL